MFEGQFLLRFDDICPTMDWKLWNAIEAELVRHQVRPILAVVPDNRDSNLMIDAPREDFWDRVRQWQTMGWTIALHGYQHTYINRNSGLMQLTDQSEFAGLSRAEQKGKLSRGINIFADQQVRVDAWIAPSHSFDRTTLEILLELGVSVLSDGLWPWPHRDDDGMTWVPQQLWEFQRRPKGIWTVNFHYNKWKDEDLNKFTKNLVLFADRITDMNTVLTKFTHRKLTVHDRIYARYRLIWYHRIRPMIQTTIITRMTRKPVRQ